MAERVEIFSGVRRRRDWSDEDKLRFVAETYEPGTSVSAVARQALAAVVAVLQRR